MDAPARQQVLNLVSEGKLWLERVHLPIELGITAELEVYEALIPMANDHKILWAEWLEDAIDPIVITSPFFSPTELRWEIWLYAAIKDQSKIEQYEGPQ